MEDEVEMASRRVQRKGARAGGERAETTRARMMPGRRSQHTHSGCRAGRCTELRVLREDSASVSKTTAVQFNAMLLSRAGSRWLTATATATGGAVGVDVDVSAQGGDRRGGGTTRRSEPTTEQDGASERADDALGLPFWFRRHRSSTASSVSSRHARQRAVVVVVLRFSQMQSIMLTAVASSRRRRAASDRPTIRLSAATSKSATWTLGGSSVRHTLHMHARATQPPCQTPMRGVRPACMPRLKQP